MKENEKKHEHQKSAGIPEALHPELGNGALLENNPHFFQLRLVDPTLSMDQFLHDEDSLKELDKARNKQIKKGLNGKTEQKFNAKKSDKNTKKKKKKKKEWVELADQFPSVESAPESEITHPISNDWLQGKYPIEANAKDEHFPKISGDDKQVTEPEGGRMKKAIQHQEDLSTQPKETETPLKTTEHKQDPSLSPFTSWIKSLSGSEYVHPYEDDYALDHLASSVREGISETLADLLAAQGFREQAIDMYQKLMARYPEKSSFFAAKIETLS